MKKIYYIVNARIPTEKAHGIQVMKMCEAFSDQGLGVELVVPRRTNKIKEDPFNYYKVRKTFTIKKLPCLDLVWAGRLGFLAQSLLFAEVAAWYMFWKRKRERDSVCFTRDELIALYLSNMRVEVVWEAHVGKSNFITKTLIRRGIKIICISNGVANYYRNLGASDGRILVAYDGVDLNKFQIDTTKEEARKKLSLPLDKKLIVYTGHLYSWKGASILAESAKQFDHGKIFVFVGGTEKDIKNFKVKYGNIKNILILGHKPYSDIPFYLKAADLLVLPNSGKEQISRDFTSPLKLFEYMASGTPIVASDLPSLKEILNNKNAFLFSSDNVKSLVDTIVAAFSDRNETIKKAMSAIESSRKFSWDNRAKTILNYFESNA